MRRKAVKLRDFPLHGAKVNSVHIGTYLESFFVVGDSHNHLRLYSFQSDEEVSVLSTNQNNSNAQTEVTAVSLSCNQEEIFSGTNRGIINLWDMETGKGHTPLRGHPTSVNCFGIYPDEPAKLASGSYDTTIKLWDIREKNSYATLKGHNKPINSLAVSPDGLFLLSGAEDNTARLWDLRYADKAFCVSNEHTAPILQVKFNPQDCMFATCSQDKTAKYFQCDQKFYGFQSTTEMVAKPISSIGFSQDGKILYTASDDILRSWNMYKNGLLIQNFETNWKGIQDLSMIKGSLMAVGSSVGKLNLWLVDVHKRIKNGSQVVQEAPLVLPKIGKHANKPEDFDLNQIQNMVGNAIQKVNSIEEKPADFEKKKQEMERKREEAEFKRQQQERRRKEQDEERKRERERKEQERREAQRIRREEQRQRQLEEEKELQEKLFKERQERQKKIEEQYEKSVQQAPVDFNTTLEQDHLQNSNVMNMSDFVQDKFARDKMKQIEVISDISKDSAKYEELLKERISVLKPIVNYWKQGRINTALDMVQSSSHPIINDFASAILGNPRFKSAISPEVGISLTKTLRDVMVISKRSTYVRNSMGHLNSIVNIFKDQLIKIKTFNPMGRVDLSRQERLAKYDRLIQQFLLLFNEERLKRYYLKKKQGDDEDIYAVAFELFVNLEEVLRKIVPNKQPEAA